MITGVSKHGFKWKIEENRLNNYDLLEAINEADKNPLKTPTVLKLLLGEEQKERFLNFLRKKNNGFVPNEIISEEIVSILTFDKLKK